MSARKGAPAGNHNAAGGHPGTGRHTGVSGLVGRALGLKQLSPGNTSKLNTIMKSATSRGRGVNFTGTEAKSFNKLMNKKNFNNPW